MMWPGFAAPSSGLLLLVKTSTVLATRACCFMLLLVVAPPALKAQKEAPTPKLQGWHHFCLRLAKVVASS